MSLRTIVYTSTQTRPMFQAEVLELLDLARAKNARLGVTGMLLEKDGDFMQALEGDSAVIRSLFDRIQLDDRHHEILVVADRAIGERVFDAWSMGFAEVRPEDFGKVEGLRGFRDLALRDPALEEDSVACALLRSFKLA